MRTKISLLLLLLIGCNPVKQVLRDQEKLEEVAKVVVLTARADSKSVEDYLKTIGIQAPVIGVGSSDPYKKSQWIEDQIAQGYDDVYFLDDSTKNLAAVDQLKAKYPNVKIRTQNVLQPNTAVPTTEEILPSDFFSKLKMRFKDFIKKVSQEKDETKEAFAMIVQAAQGKKNLTPAERKAVGDQLGDVIKTMGLGAASILPGGVIYFTILNPAVVFTDTVDVIEPAVLVVLVPCPACHCQPT